MSSTRSGPLQALQDAFVGCDEGGPFVVFVPADLEVPGLTPTETRIAAMIAHGESTKRVAELCGCRPATVRKHLEAIYRKLNVGSRAELARCIAHFEWEMPSGE